MSRKISSDDDVSMSSSENRKRYTVERKESSLSTVSNKDNENKHLYNVFLCVCKWLAAIILFSVVLFCVVASKICLLVLGQQFKSVNSTGNNDTDKTAAETSKQALFLMLLLALTIPQAVSLIYASWTSLRRKSRPWPTKQGFLLILIGGLLETISLCYITMVMLTVVPIQPDSIVLLMCGLPVVPAIWQAIKSRSRWSTMTGKLDVIKFGTSATFAVVGIALLARKVPDISGQIGIPVAFILLSIAWSPKMRKLQTQSREPSSNLCEDNRSRSYISELSAYGSGIESGVVQRIPVKRKSAHEKAAIVFSLWKLILTPLVAIAFSAIYDIVELENMSAGFKAINVSNPSFVYFMLHLFASFFGYHFGWLACSLCMQQIGYALPLTLATPISIFLTHFTGVCETSTIPLPCRSQDQAYVLVAGTLLWLGQFSVTTYYVWKSQGLVMAKAHNLLWIPSYNGVCLEQYLLLNRRNKASDGERDTQKKLSRDVNVFICTTMYHEADYEMEQLLRSIHDVDAHNGKNGRHFESHVFFDGCVRVEVLNSYVLQLASLVEKTLNVQLRGCNKMKTPYGMRLNWRLPGGMDFTIHLKDNAKVKNKKRWSQVMYMSYVLDYKEALLGVQDDQSFLLTTDADVKFTFESIVALIDQITQDPRIGAVCARTHPIGSGPVVWYQIFDYAIGHWFQKVANHMLGSVLCCPGCFSLYRCQAVREVLPTYATRVDHAFEFLTKDMGEDRWICTLMIERGWRLTYCAAAEDSTYCPESFDEFYKQRRRWTLSTLANLVLLVSQWKPILKKNEYISFLFILYQAFLVCTTVVGPSAVISVIFGGMLYSGVDLDEITIVIVLVCLVIVGYILVCLFTSQNFQLKVSKLLTFVFAVVMCIVAIGVAVQISNEIQERNAEPTAVPTPHPTTTVTTAPNPLEDHLPAAVSTLYLAGLSGILIAAALLHPKEFTCLLHGIWYLLCLPSGHLLLTIYSICNLTDRSWGTREGKSTSGGEDWYKPLVNLWKNMCKCCQDRDESAQLQQATNTYANCGSNMESRTSIKTEVVNSSSKASDQNGNRDTTSFTAKGEAFINTETTDVLRLPSDENLDSNEMEKRKIPITKSPTNLKTQHIPSNSNDDPQDNYEFPDIVVHLADELPNEASGFVSFQKVETRDGAKYTGHRTSLTREGSKEDMAEEHLSSRRSYQASPDKLPSVPSERLSLQNARSEENTHETVESRSNSAEKDNSSYRNKPDNNSSILKSQELNGPDCSVTISNKNKLVTTIRGDSIRCDSDVVVVEECGSKPNGGTESKCNQTNLRNSTGSDLEDDVFEPYSEGRYAVPQSSTDVLSLNNPSNKAPETNFYALLPADEGKIPRANSSVQSVKQLSKPEENAPAKSVSQTLSSLVISSASMFCDSSSLRSPRNDTDNISELSLKFGSSHSLRSLDENGRPVTSLKTEVSYSDLNLPIEDWLTREFKCYAPKFREHGYDTAGFLSGMTDKDLQHIGIDARGHRQKLLRDIRKIPRVDIEEDIPGNVEHWLDELGLGEYWLKFESSGYTDPSDLEDLKNMSKDSLKETFNMHKPGHLNKLISAIRKLQYPNQGQIKIRHTRRELDRLPLYYLDVDNQDDGIEYEFWEGLRQICLIPELSAFDQTSTLEEKLVELRNTTLLIFGVTNALWILITLTLVQRKDLKVSGVDIVGLGVLTVYGFIVFLQFLALLGHRFKTAVHILARTPWKLSKKIGDNFVSISQSVSSPRTPQ